MLYMDLRKEICQDLVNTRADIHVRIPKSLFHVAAGWSAILCKRVSGLQRENL